LTVAGKVDRPALSAHDIAAASSPPLPPRNGQEAMLCRLFGELTGFATVGLDDNFFDVGGSSFGAIKLVARLTKAIGGELAVSTADRTPACRRAIAKGCRLASADEIHRARPLVYLFPGIYGDQPHLGQFRAILADRVRFVLIDYPDWDRMIAATFDLNAMAEACTSQITARCGKAPILLAAYSFGGYVAFESSLRLIRSHYPVGFLGIIDAPLEFFLSRSRAGSFESAVLADDVPTLPSNRSVQDIFTLLRQTISSWCIEFAVHRCPAPLARVFAASIIPLLSKERTHSFKRRLCVALRMKHVFQWSPMPLDAPITLFRSDDPKLGSERSHGWTEVCPSLTVVPIGGDHVTILEQTQLDLLSSCFV